MADYLTTDAELIERWAPKVEIVRIKPGRTLTTGILRVEGDEVPPEEVLYLAVNGWVRRGAGQYTRRPDEDGKQVYWVNVLNMG